MAGCVGHLLVEKARAFDVKTQYNDTPDSIQRKNLSRLLTYTSQNPYLLPVLLGLLHKLSDYPTIAQDLWDLGALDVFYGIATHSPPVTATANDTTVTADAATADDTTVTAATATATTDVAAATATAAAVAVASAAVAATAAASGTVREQRGGVSRLVMLCITRLLMKAYETPPSESTKPHPHRLTADHLQQWSPIWTSWSATTDDPQLLVLLATTIELIVKKDKNLFPHDLLESPHPQIRDGKNTELLLRDGKNTELQFQDGKSTELLFRDWKNAELQSRDDGGNTEFQFRDGKIPDYQFRDGKIPESDKSDSISCSLLVSRVLHAIVKNPVMSMRGKPEPMLEEARFLSARAINYLSTQGDYNRRLIIDVGLLGDIYKNWLWDPHLPSPPSAIQRSQVYVARVISHLCKLDKDYKKKIVDEGWLLVLRRWSKSDNKQIVLAAIHAVEGLLGDDVTVLHIFEEYGMDLFIELAEMADVDVLHATENILKYLIRDGITPNSFTNTSPESFQKRHASDMCKLDDNFLEVI